MFKTHIVTGERYAQTAALLLLAVVFIPLLFFFSRAAGSVNVFLAAAGGSMLAGLAVLTLRRHSEAKILTIATPRRGSR